MEKLAGLCKEKGAVLVEDCAGSLGGRINGKLTGTFGDFGVFSFSASKTLHSPTKGGFIIAHNKESLDKIQPITEVSNDPFAFKIKQIIKAFGFCFAKNRLLSKLLFSKSNSESEHSETAYLTDTTYHRSLYEWQAKVLVNQFYNIEALLMERRKLYEKYYSLIRNDIIDCKSIN